MVLLRRVRGLAGLALTWGVAAAVLYLLLGLVGAVLASAAWPPPWYATLWWAAAEAADGVVFGAILIVRARRRTVEELVAGRVALWGLGAGLGASAVLVALLTLARA